MLLKSPVLFRSPPQLWFLSACFINSVGDRRRAAPAAVVGGLSLGEWVWQVVPESLGKQRRAALPGRGWNQAGQRDGHREASAGHRSWCEVRAQRATSGQRPRAGGRAGVTGARQGRWAVQVEWGGQMAKGTEASLLPKGSFSGPRRRLCVLERCLRRGWLRRAVGVRRALP